MKLATRHSQGPPPLRRSRLVQCLAILALLAGTAPVQPASADESSTPRQERSARSSGSRAQTSHSGSSARSSSSSSRSSRSEGSARSSSAGRDSSSGTSTRSSDSGRSSRTYSSPGSTSARDRGSRASSAGNPVYDDSGRSGPRLDQASFPTTGSSGGARSSRRHYDPDYHHHNYYPNHRYYNDWWWDWSFYYGPYWGPRWSSWPYYYGPSVYWSIGDGFWSVGGLYTPSVPYYSYERADLGGLDLNIRPKDAAVYLNGQYVGIVNNFDGFPSYLWLEPGTYHLVIFLEGYETLSREYTIHRGLVVDVKERMREGTATAVQDIPVPPRVRYELEQQQQEQQARNDREEEWRERAREYRERRQETAPEPPSRSSGLLSRDVRQDPAVLRLSVQPGDASVYLDGSFVGSASELSRLRDGLLLDAGDHLLELVRPGRSPEQRSFSVQPGQELQLSIELAAEPPQ